METTLTKYININGQLMDLSHPQVMGILNVTPDSFYAQSRQQTEEGILSRVHQILEEGGNIIDIGAYSSRPNADHISTEEEAKRLQKKIAKNQFDFNDFLTQIHQIKKMGNLKELASMIPGVGKAIKDIDIDDNAFKSIEAIIYSMTPQERTNPEILNGTRRTRIAKGSGTSIQEVNRLLKQFDQTRKMMKMVTGSKMGKMMPKLKK